jgi:hypothetical protein
MLEGKLVSIRLQVALHNYVNVEIPRKLYSEMDTNFASCFLPARWQRQQQADGLCCARL